MIGKSGKVHEVHITIRLKITSNRKYLVCAHIHPAVGDARLAVNVNLAAVVTSGVTGVDARRIAPQMHVALFVVGRTGNPIQAIGVNEQRVLINVANST